MSASAPAPSLPRFELKTWADCWHIHDTVTNLYTRGGAHADAVITVDQLETGGFKVETYNWTKWPDGYDLDRRRRKRKP